MSAELQNNDIKMDRREFMEFSSGALAGLVIAGNYLEVAESLASQEINTPAPLYTSALSEIINEPLPDTQTLIDTINADPNMIEVLDNLQANALTIANSSFAQGDTNPELNALAGVFTVDGQNTWVSVAGIEYKRDQETILFVIDPIDGKLWPNDVTQGRYSIEQENNTPMVVFEGNDGGKYVLGDQNKPEDTVPVFKAAEDANLELTANIRIPIEVTKTIAEVTTNGDGLNVRNNPGGDIISQVIDGSKLDIISKDNNGWVQVQTPQGVKGWVSEAFIQLQETPFPPVPNSFSIDGEQSSDLPDALKVEPVPMPPTVVPGTEVAPQTLSPEQQIVHEHAQFYETPQIESSRGFVTFSKGYVSEVMGGKNYTMDAAAAENSMKYIIQQSYADVNKALQRVHKPQVQEGDPVTFKSFSQARLPQMGRNNEITAPFNNVNIYVMTPDEFKPVMEKFEEEKDKVKDFIIATTLNGRTTFDTGIIYTDNDTVTLITQYSAYSNAMANRKGGPLSLIRDGLGITWGNISNSMSNGTAGVLPHNWNADGLYNMLGCYESNNWCASYSPAFTPTPSN